MMARHSHDPRVCMQKLEEIGVCYGRVGSFTVQVRQAPAEILLENAINCGARILEEMIMNNYGPYVCINFMVLNHKMTPVTLG